MFISEALSFLFSSHDVNIQDTESNMVLEHDSRDEWVFTLYNFDNSGKVTKEVLFFMQIVLSKYYF